LHKYRGDHEQSVIGASSSELGPSARGRPRSGNDLGEVEVSVWWNVAPKRGRLRDGGSSGMARSEEGSGIDSRSCRSLRGSTW